jgi:uncharacterized protein (DUF2252 family)
VTASAAQPLKSSADRIGNNSRSFLSRIRSAGSVQAILRKAERATPQHNLLRLTVGRKGAQRRFARRPPLLKPVDAGIKKRVLSALRSYRETLSGDRQLLFDAYHPADVASKVVGIGSVGTRDYVVLLFGRSQTDPLFLQVKEEPAPCFGPYLAETGSLDTQGQRVAEAQRRIQTAPDLFVGWTRIGDRGYLVRQLADHKATIDPNEFRGEALSSYARVCGEVFAKAHARTGDVAFLTGYCGRSGRLDEAMRKFARKYADQVDSDFASFRGSVRAQRVKVRRGI